MAEIRQGGKFMSNSLVQAAYWFVYISLELSILFIGITFIIGLITSYVSPQKVESFLSKYGKGVIGNILGTAVGGLIPFCSCSTIPAVAGLLNVGVPFRIAMSFLIASPLGVFNVAVFSLFALIFGFKVAILYIITTFIGAVLAGLILGSDRLNLKSEVKLVRIIGKSKDEDPLVVTENAGRWEKIKSRLIKSWVYARGLYKQMIPFLLIGVGVGAFIYGFVPEEFFLKCAGPENPFAVPIAAAVGVPMYVRTETMIPICSALVNKGVGMGTVMALIIGGAGASIPEVSLLSALFKKKLLIGYLITIFSIATIIGYLFNFIF